MVTLLTATASTAARLAAACSADPTPLARRENARYAASSKGCRTHQGILFTLMQHDAGCEGPRHRPYLDKTILDPNKPEGQGSARTGPGTWKMVRTTRDPRLDTSPYTPWL